MILNKDLIQKINLCEKVTRARIKDVFNFNGLLIVVNFGDLGRAIGKNGASIRKYAGLINERVKVVEFNPDYMIFLKNLVMPLQVHQVEEKDGFINIHADTKTKALLIGRNQKNLGVYNAIFKKYFNKEIRIR